ncbi:MAG: peptidylprolyl isomerase, partial [Endozoicomonadaceae bacterium]|nr:peptidylprolyl isomerase [Endozoicomonadaceae bacterium]
MFVTLQTTMGKIKISLDKEKAPKTTENFIQYVQSGHYNNTIFHRVISGFMIQGGGMDVNMKEKETNPPI